MGDVARMTVTAFRDNLRNNGGSPLTLAQIQSSVQGMMRGTGRAGWQIAAELEALLPKVKPMSGEMPKPQARTAGCSDGKGNATGLKKHSRRVNDVVNVLVELGHVREAGHGARKRFTWAGCSAWLSLVGQARLQGGQARLQGGQARLQGGQARLQGGQARLQGDQPQVDDFASVRSGSGDIGSSPWHPSDMQWEPDRPFADRSASDPWCIVAANAAAASFAAGISAGAGIGHGGVPSLHDGTEVEDPSGMALHHAVCATSEETSAVSAAAITAAIMQGLQPPTPSTVAAAPPHFETGPGLSRLCSGMVQVVQPNDHVVQHQLVQPQLEQGKRRNDAPEQGANPAKLARQPVTGTRPALQLPNQPLLHSLMATGMQGAQQGQPYCAQAQAHASPCDALQPYYPPGWPQRHDGPLQPCGTPVAGTATLPAAASYALTSEPLQPPPLQQLHLSFNELKIEQQHQIVQRQAHLYAGNGSVQAPLGGGGHSPPAGAAYQEGVALPAADYSGNVCASVSGGGGVTSWAHPSASAQQQQQFLPQQFLPQQFLPQQFLPQQFLPQPHQLQPHQQHQQPLQQQACMGQLGLYI
ncbi:hypothetical protein GPECTOR_2g1134 [Gonium pectorale]|uniref:Uncharacterized protein n=1 Tax=Gonium pectorale TaxID=33097 RepID=A0A150H0M2_GONPE|nr:hypothetical protein GPECTOR_2g1134 [Gonium pectorale]|eukprot:KXZ55584.1 hypothetical protein GPECTOR_2g1134 [Gonium pectorale]